MLLISMTYVLNIIIPYIELTPWLMLLLCTRCLVSWKASTDITRSKMHKDDTSKVSFITDFDVFCYLVMAFGLKNAEATYQRLVNNIYKHLIRKTMDVYVDDILVKSLDKADHIKHLHEAFEVLRHHRMMLNPSKYAFGVGSGKFLGLMVSKRGIEANLDKIKAILGMEAPTSINDVQKLTGGLAALGRFISKLGEKCLPFFRCSRKWKNLFGLMKVREHSKSWRDIWMSHLF